MGRVRKLRSDGAAGMFEHSPLYRKFKEVIDGLSNILLSTEILPRRCTYASAYGPNFSVAGIQLLLNLTAPSTWWSPEDEYWVPSRTGDGCEFKSNHPGGVHFLMGDGSIHFFSLSKLPT